MISYREELSKVNNMFVGFINNRKIEVNKLDSMNNLIAFATENQVRVLNSGYFSLNEQIVLFGTLTNVKNVTETIKQRLAVASEKHENPTTAELALEMMPSFYNLVPYIDDFVNNKPVRDIDRLDEFSRILHRKANKFGFSKDIKTQFKEANITTDDVKEFVEKLKTNIEIELDIEIDEDPK